MTMNRFICEEVMKQCWHEFDACEIGDYHSATAEIRSRYCIHCKKVEWMCAFPDYSTGKDKAALMDKCVGEEWFPKLLDYTFNKAFDESEESVESFLQSDSSRDTFYTYQVYAYLWRNLSELVAEYKGYKENK